MGPGESGTFCHVPVPSGSRSISLAPLENGWSRSNWRMKTAAVSRRRNKSNFFVCLHSKGNYASFTSVAQTSIIVIQMATSEQHLGSTR